jgi:hypothetical protein
MGPKLVFSGKPLNVVCWRTQFKDRSPAAEGRPLEKPAKKLSPKNLSRRRCDVVAQTQREKLGARIPIEQLFLIFAVPNFRWGIDQRFRERWCQ